MKRIIFCGFGKLGRECLSVLKQKGFFVDFVLTHRELKKESVDTYAEENLINYSYIDMRTDIKKMTKMLSEIVPDYLISVNYRYIIPFEILKIANYSLNIHGSLLPKYRGRTPHVWSIINGEQYSGVTCHLIEESVDTGDIIKQKKILIDENDTGFSLLKKFEHIYPELLLDSLDHLEKNKSLLKQNEENASYFGKRIPEMGYIDFYKDCLEVKNFIRAQSNPYPGAYYFLANGKKIIIDRIEETHFCFEGSIGQIKAIEDKYFVKCKNGNLEILEYRVI